MTSPGFPKLRIRVPDGRAIFTTVELDGRQLPATRVAFDTGDVGTEEHGVVKVRIDFYADIDVELEGGTPAVVGMDEVGT